MSCFENYATRLILPLEKINESKFGSGLHGRTQNSRITCRGVIKVRMTVAEIFSLRTGRAEMQAALKRKRAGVNTGYESN